MVRGALVLVIAGAVVGCEGKGSAGAGPVQGHPGSGEPGAVCIHGDGAECPHHAADAPVKTADSSSGHFGAAFEIASARPLTDAIAGADTSDGPVRIVGTIESVCKRRGCWMVVRDGDATARVLFKDYAFTVPMDSEARKADVEGVLTTRTFTKAQARHIEEDRGGDPKAVVAAKTEFVLTATGVQID